MLSTIFLFLLAYKFNETIISFDYQKISFFSHNTIEGKNIHNCWIKFKRILRVTNDTCMFSLKFLGSLQREDEVEGMALFRPSLFHVRLSTK